MNNKNLLIGVGVAVVVYYLYNQNQKKKLEETTTYDDAELNKVVTDYVNKSIAYTQKREPNVKHKTFKEIFDGIMQLINNAKANNKDVSKKNINKLLSILELQYRNESGDISLGQTTKEQFDFIVDLTQKQTVTVAQNPAQNNQLSSAPKVSDKPCKKWVQMTCITTPCPPTCVER